MNKIILGLTAASLLGTTSAQEALWKSTVLSGSWNTPSNWQDEVVPEAPTDVNLNRNGNDYTISVDDSASANNLYIRNTSGKTALNVNADMSVGNILKVGEVNDPQGAQMTIGSAGCVSSASPTTAGDALRIYDACLVVDGGVVDFNHGKGLTVQGKTAAPAKLVVTNGATFAWHKNGAEDGRLNVNDAATIHVHDSVFCVDQNGRNQYYGLPWNLAGGSIVFSGSSVLTNKNYATSGKKAPFTVGYGSLVFKDDARFEPYTTDSVRMMAHMAAPDGKTGLWTFADRATLTKRFYSIIVGDSAPGRSVLTWASAASTILAREMEVGFGRGEAEFVVTAGHVTVGNQQGLHVARAQKSLDSLGFESRFARVTDASQFAATGMVRVAGGALYVNAVQSVDSAYSPKHIGGLVIGDGAADSTAYSGRPNCGCLDLSSGCVTNEHGYLAVGVGHAVGRIVQTGGRLYNGSVSSPGWDSRYPVVVGLAGGVGSYVISNGVANVYAPMYVGGASIDDMRFPTTAMSDAANYPAAARDAEGVLTLARRDAAEVCSLTIGNIQNVVNKGLWVGRDGTGTVEIIGSGSTLTTHGLVLTNGYETSEGQVLTHGQAKLRFVFDANGVGQIVVSGNQAISIAPNAKIEVDMSKFKGKDPICLISCSARNGSFAEENLKLKHCRLIQKDGDPNIYAKRIGRGLVITVK